MILLRDTEAQPKGICEKGKYSILFNIMKKKGTEFSILNFPAIKHHISSPSKQITANMSHSFFLDKFTFPAVLSEIIQEMKTSSCPRNILPIRYLKDNFNGVSVSVIQRTCYR